MDQFDDGFIYFALDFFKSKLNQASILIGLNFVENIIIKWT